MCSEAYQQTVNFLRNLSTYALVIQRPGARKVLFTSAQFYCDRALFSDLLRRVVLRTVGLLAPVVLMLALVESNVSRCHAGELRVQVAPRRAAGSRPAETRVNVQWSGVTLRQAMLGLSRSTRQAILIDRRVDPDQTVKLVRESATPREIVDAAAEGLSLSVVRLGPLLYIAPPATAERMEADFARQTAAARRLPAAEAKLWSRRAPLAWSELAEPRTILTELGEREKIGVRGAELVPHDLWPSAELPALTLVERLTLVLAQFDLTWRYEDEGRAIAIVPLEAEPRETPRAR